MLQCWTEVCHQISSGWETQTMWNLHKNVWCVWGRMFWSKNITVRVVRFPKCWHQSTMPHTAVRIVETICQFDWIQLLFPPNSPNLGPSDFRLFGLIKEFLYWAKFSSDDEMKNTESKWQNSVQRFLCWRNIKTCFLMGKMGLF